MYGRLSDLVTPDVPIKWKSAGAKDRRKAEQFPWWGCSDQNSCFMTSTHLWLPLHDPVNGTQVCKENTIAERNVPDLSSVYHLFKSWTDRVTNLGSLENTLGSLLTSKATPQAAKSSSVEQAITDTDSNTKSRHAHYKHFFDCLTKVKKGYVYPVVHSLRNA